MKTIKASVNQKFLATLRKECPQSISNPEAYAIYDRDHRRTHPSYGGALGDATFAHMNVRTQLGKMAELGIIIRVRPGHYVWAPEPENEDMAHQA